MLKATKQLVSHSAIYGIGNVLTKLVAFVLIPLYARKLVPAEYGLVAMLELLEIFGKTILGLGLNNAVLRFYHAYRREGKENELVSSLLTVILLLGLLGSGILVLLEKPLTSSLLNFRPENLYYYRLMILVIFCGIIQLFFIVLLQAQEKPVAYSAYQFGTFVLLIALNIYKVGFLNQGVRGVVESKLYVAILGFMVALIVLLRSYSFRFAWHTVKQSLAYGSPLVFVGISATILTLADRYFLKIYSTLDQVGIYSMAYKFGMIVNMVLVTPFRTAFFPIMFRLAEEGDVKRLYRKYHTYFLIIGIYLFLMLSLFARELMIVFTSEKYYAGYFIIPFIAFSYLLFGVRTIHVNVLAAQKKTVPVALSTLMGALLNILLNIWFIPLWGSLGAAIATLISYFAIAVGTYLPQQRIFPVQWDWPRAGQLLLYAVLCLLVGFSLPQEQFWQIMAMKGLLLVVFPMLLWMGGFFTPGEKQDIKALLFRVRGKVAR